MVHALEECWRVLIPGGQVIDLRPLSVDPPFEVIFPTEIKMPGLMDMSPDRESEVAADRAIEEVTRAGIFTTKDKVYFDFAYYWDSIEAAIVYIQDEWEGSAILSDELVKMVRNMQAASQERLRVRIRLRLKLTSLDKV
jgi:hypothetical protein